jgi:nucleotide-binding universal stress UspA family protein
MNVKKIVVAVDGSPHSLKAMEWAMDMATRYDAQIATVTVVKPPEFSPTISEVDEFYEDAENHCRPMLQKLQELGKEHGLDVNTQILRGHPAESIVKYAYDNTVDLIITGTRGLGGFKNLVIGSVAQKVVTYSKIPVLVVKD